MNFANIRGAIWDFDGVFYSYDGTDPQEFYDLADKLTARAAQFTIPGLDAKTAFEIAVKSHEKHESPVEGFLALARERQFPEDQVKAYLFNHYQRALFDYTKRYYPALFDPRPEFVNAFRANGDLDHAIVSHSSGPFWVRPVLAELGMNQDIDPEYIFGYESYDYKSKHISAKGVSLALTKMGLHPSNAVFVEDTHRNLIRAKQRYPGLRTVFITDEAEPQGGFEGVDLVVKDATEFLNHLVYALRPEVEAQPGP